MALFARATADDPEPVELPDWAGTVWNAFWRLHADRPQHPMPIALPMGGMTVELAPGRIPWRLIDRYAARYGIVGEEFEFLHAMVSDLDNEWMAWCREQREREG